MLNKKSNDKQTVGQVAFNPTKKKKDTYVIQFAGVLADMTLWSWCEKTPMPVVKINGIPTENTKGGFMSCTEFPNPGASEMAEMARIPEWCEFAGNLHAQIVEYRDKETNKPILMLFPNGRVLYARNIIDIPNPTLDDIKSRLNHASRRDLTHQIAKREKALSNFKPIYARRVAAMANAPTDTQERYMFIKELDKRQLDYVRQLKLQNVH